MNEERQQGRIEELKKLVEILCKSNDELREQNQSLLCFQSSAHSKKVRAKHDRDDVINQKVVLELENRELKATVARLRAQVSASIPTSKF